MAEAKRARKTPATQLTLEYLRGRGMIVDKVEHLIHMPAPKPDAATVDRLLNACVHGSMQAANELRKMILGKPELFPKKHDMFNIFDVVGLAERQQQTYFVQTTGASSMFARVHKMKEHVESIRVARACDNLIELHGWEKVDGFYQVRVFEIDWNGKQGVVYKDVTSDLPTLATVRKWVRSDAKGVPLFEQPQADEDDDF